MPEHTLALALGIVLAGVVLYFVLGGLHGSNQPGASGSDYEMRERSQMPDELASATLVLSESYMNTKVPRRVGAKFDQVYKTTDGRLIPVDTKHRRRTRVTDYDRIEVSVQAAILRHAGLARFNAKSVPDYAYIRFDWDDRKPVYTGFRLLTDDALAELVDRYWSIADGQAAPRTAASVGACRKCAYLRSCQAGQAKVAAAMER